MKYIENELKRCEGELHSADGDRYSYLYAVQQALSWVLDPMGYASPIDTVLNDKVGTTDIPADSADYLDAPRLP